MNEPKVSVICPVFNAGMYIEETIQSVKSQTFEDWELILVDDCSTDSSVSTIEKYAGDRIRLIRLETNSGAAAARNAGLDAALGRYIAYIDADDMWDREKLKKQLAFMEEKKCAFSFTGYEFADSDGVGVQKIVRVPERIGYRRALKNTTIFTSTVLFDLEMLDRKLLRMPLVPSEDTAAWWQILRNGYDAYGLDEALTLYRRSEGTLSSNKLEAVRRVWNLYRNVEGLSVCYSAICFAGYAWHAVMRRI